jgi:GTPase-associated protein 1, N-terminal domain type 2/GTPase-associated protein 1, middle domain
MAGQAHYTSAPPSSDAPHGGFRFTAVSPTARPALDVLRPLTGYARPPGTDRHRHFPVAFAYDRPNVDAAVLTRTRFTGRDYTGRWGNHFCHAMYATPDELAGLRPVELWDTPHWALVPAHDDGHDLSDLTHLVPGSAVGPDRVARMLAGLGAPGVPLLERLLTAALRALVGDGPGATLVSADPDRIVDWIAAVSYTLPAGMAARLTFTTYTARPEDDHRHLTGTGPETAERAPGPAFHLDRLTGDGCPEPSPTARFLAGALASGRLDVLDAVAELWDAGPADGVEGGVRRLRDGCALLAPEGDAGAFGGEGSRLAVFVRAVAELRPEEARLAPERLTDAAARHLAEGTAPLGDVRAALAPLPEPYRSAVLAGLLAALEASVELRTAALDGQACASLASLTDEPPDALAATPGTALHVLRRASGEPRPTALRILRLYRQGLWEETETYDALRDLVRPEESERAPRLLWSRGPARGRE